ncbi:MAG TPA: Rieske 2Fe-2S domain-containing protein, partial [Candidatus Dormibacteraeota bacterium]
TIDNGVLRCAYHGWEYDRTGACVRIPALPEGSPIPRKARAINYHAAEAYGLVWVALAEPAAPIPAWPENEYDDPAYKTILAYREVWNSSAGRALENFMDVSHFAFVHTGLLGSLDDTLVEAHEVKTTDYGFAYDLHQEEANSELKGLTLREYRIYFPFTAYIRRIASDGHVSIISLTASPVSPKRTELFMFISRNHSFDEPDNLFTDFNDTVMAQDRAIVESQRPEEIPSDLRDELHVKVPDAAAIAFRRLLGQLDNVEDHMP